MPKSKYRSYAIGEALVPTESREPSHRFSNTKSLRDKIAAATGISAVNMNPTPATVKVEPEPKAPDVSSLIADPEECEALCQLIYLHAHLTNQLKPLEKDRDAITARIKNMIATYGIEAATYQGIALSYYQNTRSSINKMKLLEAGVGIQVINECTDTTVSHSLKITPAKEDK
jgi:hypothetical protein